MEKWSEPTPSYFTEKIHNFGDLILAVSYVKVQCN